MKRLLLFFSIIFYSNIFSQIQKTITITDQETDKPIPRVRLMWKEHVFYTNDDGKVIMPSNAKDIIITSPLYLELKVVVPLEIIRLVPKYEEIEEVIIKNIDIKKNIFDNVLKNYNKNYSTLPIIYNIQIKQKAKEENKLNNLFIADLKLWLIDSEYHNNLKYDSFAQISLEKVKYYQTRKFDRNYIFDNDINIRPDQFIRKIFLNDVLSGILNDTKRYKISANIISEDSAVQTIKFKSDNIEGIGIDFSGKVLFNKMDNAITYLKLDVNQAKTFSDKTNKNGEKYKSKTTLVSFVYEFYKNGEKYIPTRYELTGRGIHIYKNIESPYDFFQEIIYKSSEPGSKKGLFSKIDLSKNLTENVSLNNIKDTKTLLSTEEQKFVNEP